MWQYYNRSGGIQCLAPGETARSIESSNDLVILTLAHRKIVGDPRKPPRNFGFQGFIVAEKVAQLERLLGLNVFSLLKV
jgi:hypothetical protein